jgi:hypothetical protein
MATGDTNDVFAHVKRLLPPQSRIETEEVI